MKNLTFFLKVLLSLVFLRTASVSAQIQQAWVAKYNNNGITTGNHQALKIALDQKGNIYLLGVSANANTNTGYAVVKYGPSGDQLWSARYDSTNFASASPTAFALDSSNAVVVTGNAVTVKYDANGRLLWAQPYSGQAVAVDSSQDSYITGTSNNFTTIKLNPIGSNLWSQRWTYQGLPNLSQAIALDSSDNVYVAGKEGVQMPTGDVAVHIGTIKYDSNGNQLWEVDTSAGSFDYDVQVVGFQLDSLNNIYIEANYLDGGFSLPYSTYVYNSNGLGVAIAGNPTGSIASMSHGVAVDNQGNIFVTGTSVYAYDTYATYKIVGTNESYVWTNSYPSTPSGNSTAAAVAVDNVNYIYVTGESSITNAPYDIATLKLDPNGNQLWVQRYKGQELGDGGNAIAVDNSGNVYVAGYETETNGFTSMILIKYSPVTIQKQSNGNVILHAYGSPGENFDLQASTNLQTWQDLGSFVADTNGVALFEDTNAPLFPNRFYYTVPQ